MRIYLRPLEKEDSSLIVRWRNTEKVLDHCFDKRTITEKTHLDFYRKYIETGKYKQFIVERIEEVVGVASYPIATVYLKDIDTINKRCEMCIFTSDDEEWNTESQTIAVGLLLGKAFEDYGLHKVFSYVFAHNDDEIALLESAGFMKEALLHREAISISGNYCDVYRMAVFKGETAISNEIE